MTTTGQAGRQVEETFKRFGSLINFAMLLVSFLALFVYVGSWKTTVETDNAAMKQWQINHEAYHRDRLADTKEVQGAVNSRLSAIERMQQEEARKNDSQEQRLAAMEKAVDTVEQNAALTNRTLNEMNGSLQVMKEILSRIEKKQGG